MQPPTREKRAEGFHPDATLEPTGIEGGHDQPRQPTPACLGFPAPRLRMAVASRYGHPETMHTAFGKTALLGQVANAPWTVVTKTLENAKTAVPKSPVGLCSEG